MKNAMLIALLVLACGLQARAQTTTLFGWTLGKPAVGDGSSGLGAYAAHGGPHVRCCRKSVELITAAFQLSYCAQVEEALSTKFGKPNLTQPWEGRSSFGPVSGVVLQWIRATDDSLGETVVYRSVNPNNVGECSVEAVTGRYEKAAEKSKPTL